MKIVKRLVIKMKIVYETNRRGGNDKWQFVGSKIEVS